MVFTFGCIGRQTMTASTGSRFTSVNSNMALPTKWLWLKRSKEYNDKLSVISRSSSKRVAFVSKKSLNTGFLDRNCVAVFPRSWYTFLSAPERTSTFTNTPDCRPKSRGRLTAQMTWILSTDVWKLYNNENWSWHVCFGRVFGLVTGMLNASAFPFSWRL